MVKIYLLIILVSSLFAMEKETNSYHDISFFESAEESIFSMNKNEGEFIHKNKIYKWTIISRHINGKICTNILEEDGNIFRFCSSNPILSKCIGYKDSAELAIDNADKSMRLYLNDNTKKTSLNESYMFSIIANNMSNLYEKCLSNK